MMSRTKQFRHGLVVGKFCPLHKGHEFLIERALAACEQVTLISYTKPEFDHCSRAIRESWLIRLFPTAKILVIDDTFLHDICKEHGLPLRDIPHNDAPDDGHRQFVSWLCCEVLRCTVDAVFTSEDYGDGFAEALSVYFRIHANSETTVTHVCVDKSRLAVPVSGTGIRMNPHRFRKFLSPLVYASFIKRTCLLGGESSGKTTLAQAIATHLSTAWVPEYGRELWDEKRGKLEFSDMLRIAREQIAREINYRTRAQEWLICDTSPLTTLFYSEALFGDAEEELRDLANRKYDCVFLCSPDFPFVQDGTRRSSEFRSRQHVWYLNELRERDIKHTLLSGSLADRIQTVLKTLTQSIEDTALPGSRQGHPGKI